LTLNFIVILFPVLFSYFAIPNPHGLSSLVFFCLQFSVKLDWTSLTAHW